MQCGYNNINDPYAKLCVLDDVENIYVKVYNLMSRTDETRDENDMKPANVNLQLQI